MKKYIGVFCVLGVMQPGLIYASSGDTYEEVYPGWLTGSLPTIRGHNVLLPEDRLVVQENPLAHLIIPEEVEEKKKGHNLSNREIEKRRYKPARKSFKKKPAHRYNSGRHNYNTGKRRIK